MGNLNLIINILFLSLLGLGVLVGFVRGFKKSLYSLITMIIFYVLFFLTIDWASTKLYHMSIPWLGDLIGSMFPELSHATSLDQIVPIILRDNLSDSLGSVLTNQDFIAFVDSISILFVKIIYLILYFTLFYFIYKLICFIIRKAFSSDKKKYPESNGRGFGAIVGLIHGGLTVYFLLIIFGGFISIADNTMKLLPEDEQNETIVKVVDDYKHNPFVEAADFVRVNDENQDLSVNNYLFDKIFSFHYRDKQISIRKELSISVEIKDIYQHSQYKSSNNVSDITGEEVNDVFIKLSNSDLFIVVLPLGIECLTEYYDHDISIPKDELYDINWSTELKQIGDISAISADMIHHAQLNNEGADLKTVSFNGDDMRDLFDSLSDSELASLTAYHALEPLLEKAGSDVQAIITVPNDIVWEDEFNAIGLVAGAVVDTGITISDFESEDPAQIMSSLSNLDYTVILNSKIVSQALINIISGNANVKEFNVFVVPNDVVWYDIYDNQGKLTQNGELRNLLNAFNAITEASSDFDFNQLDMNVFAHFTDENINQVFESRVMVATLSSLINDMDMGTTPLVIPDSIYDDHHYIKKEELIALVKSARIIALNLTCDVENTCGDTGIDVSKMFNLSDDDVNTLLSSHVISSTVGSLIIDQGHSVLTIPIHTLDTIYVNQTQKSIIKMTELKKLFKAASALNITNLNATTFDANIIKNLSTKNNKHVLDEIKANQVLDSDIIHATLSSMLINLPNDQMVIPIQDMYGIPIQYMDDVEYISNIELIHVLKAVLVFELSDFNDINTIQLAVINQNINTLLDSAIFHATVSKNILDLDDSVLIVPMYTQGGETEDNQILLEVGTTNFIAKDEIKGLVYSLIEMNYKDLNHFGSTIPTEDFLNAPDTVLESSSIQATVSKRILDASEVNSQIVIPQEDIYTSQPIQIEENDVTYIDSDELQQLLISIHKLNFTEFNNINLDIVDILNADVNQLMESRITQASISQMILNHALDDSAAPGSNQLIVPNYYRETIAVGPVNSTSYQNQINKDELKHLLVGLQTLNISNLEDEMNVNIIMSLSDEDKNLILESGSLHVTLDNMIKGNPNIIIPSDVLVDDYGMTNIIMKDEVKAFITAPSPEDFTDVTFDLTFLSTLNETQIDVALNSKIVRNSITDEVEGMIENDDTYSIDNTFYENNDPTLYLSKDGLIEILQHYNYY